MSTRRIFSTELRQDALRMLRERESEYESQWAAMNAIAQEIGCSGETVRTWLRNAERELGIELEPKKKWTKADVLEAASQCSSRSEFLSNYKGAYGAAKRLGIYEEVRAILPSKKREGAEGQLFWTKERVLKAAKLYKTRNEFQYSKHHAGAYRRAQRQGWLDEVCAHMKAVKHGYRHCVYVIKNDRLNLAYVGITRQKFRKRVVQHKQSNNGTHSSMIANLPDTEFVQLTDYDFTPEEVKGAETDYYKKFRELGYKLLNHRSSLGVVGVREAFWTLEACKREALKYKTRTEFQENSRSAYSSAQTNGWLDQIYGHMEELRKPKGYWTRNRVQAEASKYTTRNEFKMGAGAAYDFALKQGWIDAVCQHMREVKKPKGYWSYERVAAEAKRSSSTSEFLREAPEAYSAATNHGWFKELTAHMEKRESRGFWTYEQVAKEASKYSTRNEFRKANESAYKKACDSDWLDEVCKHMLTPVEIRAQQWPKSRVHYEAKKYRTRRAFQKGSSYAYRRAREEGWLDEVCAHMQGRVYTKGPTKWNKEAVAAEALKYRTRTDFMNNAGGAYNRALAEGWIEEVCEHMMAIAEQSSGKKPNGFWTKDRVATEAAKYATRKEFSKGAGSAYSIAGSNGWLEEVCSHMVEIRKPKGYWTKERVAEEAQKYARTADFLKHSSTAYKAAKRYGWFSELTAHMKTGRLEAE